MTHWTDAQRARLRELMADADANLAGADLRGARLAGANMPGWERGPDGFARRVGG